MIAAVEHVEAQRIDRPGRPQPQRVDMRAAPADDRRIVGDGLDRLFGVPDKSRVTAAPGYRLDPSAVIDIVGDLRPLELPGVGEGQPFLRKFLLPAIVDDLAEEAVVVADAIAAGRDAEARHAFEEARRETAE